MEKTTIQLNKNTLERLKMFKRHDRESYEEVVVSLMDDAKEDVFDEAEIEEIKAALDEVKRGKIKPIEQFAKEQGIVLI